MISFLEGLVESVLPTRVILNVAGVGYQVEIPLSSADKIPPVGARVRLLTHLVVREDAHTLYGFMSEAERDLFLLLAKHVTGVGPKLALAVLSGMSVPLFKAAVVSGDVAALAKISGLGKKTAERIVLELKDKLGVAAAWEVATGPSAPDPLERAVNDAVLALISLGYKQVEAQRVVRQVAREDVEGAPESEVFVKKALRILAGA
ncbi:MAG: Holliday junction branch migration protein RuvA [Verrucomicrobiia bacterium]